MLADRKWVMLWCVLSSVAIADDLPPGVTNTQNPEDVSLSPAESLARIEVPDGFQVTQFAAEPDIRRPIAFDFDDRGRMWVVENYSHPQWKDGPGVDRVVILEDTDGDGRFDRRKIFYDKGRYLTGIAVGFGGVWLANTPELVFLPDADGDDIPDGPEQPLLDGFQISTNNVLNNLHWGPDGWLYGAIGLSTKSLVGAPGTDDVDRTQISRGIWRYHPTRKVFEKVAEGMVNPWGADFNEYGDLITANTVLAHLWHIVPGMYAERRASERDNPYAYQRIQTIANHLHWGGGGWQSSRNPSSRKGRDKVVTSDHQHDEQYQQHSVAGGGHAHCGAMIYLGDNWPDEFRGAFFTNNLHGNRVNCDRLKPSGSTYTGVHAPDMFAAHDPWFRGMNIKYGPDGGVFVSDWHDFGECHDSDGSHRSSGRIYKFTWGQPGHTTFDLATESDRSLAIRLTHTNAWFARHAARLLQERAGRRELSAECLACLQRQLQEGSVTGRLQALWTLSRVAALSPARLVELTSDTDPHMRRWAVRLLADPWSCDMARVRVVDRETPASLTQALLRCAEDPSPKVRLEVACSLQRIGFRDRLRVATVLSQHAVDETDACLPLLIWYGIEPAVAAWPAEGLALAAGSKLSLIPRFVARRLMETGTPQTERVLQLVRDSADRQLTRQLLLGMQEGLSGRGSQSPPDNWPQAAQVAAGLQDDQIPSLLLQLATTFGDPSAIRRVRRTMDDPNQSLAARREALQTLMALDDGLQTADLHRLVTTASELCDEALRALVSRSDERTSAVLLQTYARLTQSQRQLAVGVLVTRVAFAAELLDAIEAGQISSSDVTSWSLQQLRSIRDSGVQQRVSAIWSAEGDELKRVAEIDRLSRLMTPRYVAAGDLRAGRRIFDRTCAKCHRLFGEGGTIAPDLTGSGRQKADYVIRNLVDPSAEIDAAYRLTTVVTADGRVINGFIIRQDDRWLTIRNQDATVRLNMNDVDEVVTSRVSMMPEGMLKTFSDEEFRDLLRYLASEEQIDG